jgi:hypothetical protein
MTELRHYLATLIWCAIAGGAFVLAFGAAQAKPEPDWVWFGPPPAPAGSRQGSECPDGSWATHAFWCSAKPGQQIDLKDVPVGALPK